MMTAAFLARDRVKTMAIEVYGHHRTNPHPYDKISRYRPPLVESLENLADIHMYLTVSHLVRPSLLLTSAIPESWSLLTRVAAPARLPPPCCCFCALVRAGMSGVAACFAACCCVASHCLAAAIHTKSIGFGGALTQLGRAHALRVPAQAAEKTAESHAVG